MKRALTSTFPRSLLGLSLVTTPLLAANVSGSGDKCNQCSTDIKDHLNTPSGTSSGSRHSQTKGHISVEMGTGPIVLSHRDVSAGTGFNGRSSLLTFSKNPGSQEGETTPDVLFAAGSYVYLRGEQGAEQGGVVLKARSDMIRSPELLGLYNFTGDPAGAQQLLVHSAGPNGGIWILEANTLVTLWRSGVSGEAVTQSSGLTALVADLDGDLVPELAWRRFMGYKASGLEIYSFKGATRTGSGAWSSPTSWRGIIAGNSGYLYPMVGNVWADKDGPEIFIWDYSRGGVVQLVSGDETPRWDEGTCTEVPCAWTQFGHGNISITPGRGP